MPSFDFLCDAPALHKSAKHLRFAFTDMQPATKIRDYR